MKLCTKRCYDSKRDAHTAMNAALKRRRNNPGNLRCYFCHQCQAWHLTKMHIDDYDA